MSINEIITTYIESKNLENAAKKRAESMKALLIEYSKGAELFETDIYTVIIKTTESARLDTAALYKDFPDIKETYGKITTSKSITAVAKESAEKKSA